MKKVWMGCAAAALLAPLGGCLGPVRDTIYSPCLIQDSKGWAVELEPITDKWGKTRSHMVVTGTVTVPSGMAARLDAGALQKLKPRVQQFILRTVPTISDSDAGVQALRIRYPLPRDVGSVIIRCGDRTLAIVPVPTTPAAS